MSKAETSPGPFHPHELEVAASRHKPGSFEWSIRTRGKLMQRGDKVFRSEAEAQRDGEKAIGHLLNPDPKRR